MTPARLGLIAALGCSACAPGEITGSTGLLSARPDARPDTPDARPDSPDARPDTPDARPDSPDAGPDAGGPGPVLGRFKLTYYYVADEADYGGTKDTPLYEPGCSVLAVVPSDYAHDVIIEGTGMLDDGQVFNYAGPCACESSPCFRFVDAQHPWGVGASGRGLLPFRSIAVDETVLALGKRYYVAELDGVMMPDMPPTGGFTHDGCVSADDTGGDILGMHIDFFAALRRDYLVLDGQLGVSDITLHDGGARCP
jgi:3D (Asp-Asp-Asp) domain-containing protein